MGPLRRRGSRLVTTLVLTAAVWTADHSEAVIDKLKDEGAGGNPYVDVEEPARRNKDRVQVEDLLDFPSHLDSEEWKTIGSDSKDFVGMQ